MDFTTETGAGPNLASGVATPTEVPPPPKLCGCGCARPVLWNRKKRAWEDYRKGHRWKRPTQTNVSCACGCGYLLVHKISRPMPRWKKGHHTRDPKSRKAVSDHKKKYAIRNEGAFECVTPESAYWVGFLLADGSVRRDRNRSVRQLVLKISAKDRRHME